MTRVIPVNMNWPAPDVLFASVAERPGAFFLDSAWQGKESHAYSFIGFDPFLNFRSRNGCTTIEDVSAKAETVRYDDPLDVLRELLREYSSPGPTEIPFSGGAVGFFSYEMGAKWEKISPRNDDFGSDCEFSFYDGVLVFSHATSEWFCGANSRAGMSAETLTEDILNVVMASLDHPATVRFKERSSPMISREDRSHYLHSVARIRDFIEAGDIYQVNLAHAFEGSWHGSAYSLYQRLREETPAPFGAYLTTSFGQLLSCSPENFFRLRNREIETRPIKGTRPRGRSSKEDAEQVAALTNSAKERAELLMIVDLERNDLGRVCVPGTIRVKDLYSVQMHPTVFHLVATVSGKLDDRYDACDVVRAMFPGGSITGAPKVRAMQIIRELETYPRGPYTGAIGYFGFDGSADFNIAIRTVELRGERASFQVGAGIVWDSHPESEYEETLAKGRALRAAIE